VVRTFWLLHRTAYRLTGGRFGLSRPEAGNTFGMLRLTTTGRRSGQPRVAIIGYYEDGPNLVTLAMNGWGEKEPAWWLNLQAQPSTTVKLPGETRAVRARAAVGHERDRLWAKFRDYPGWGDDIDGLATRRSSHTAVVVLEPRTDPGSPTVEESQRSRQSMVAGTTMAARAARPASARVRARRLRRRHLWLVPGLAIAISANQLGNTNGVGILALIAFGVAPDLPRLLGSRGRAMHNLLHHPASALVAVAVAAVGAVAVSGAAPVVWLVASLVWLSHIVIGRAIGDVPRPGAARREA
jgi:deazaflavin-dependent oxidoreductase (nitroreductase family)